ncbi:hypothetical protein D9M68_541570 [compost metagenome]
MNACPMGQRRNDQADIVFRRAWHQIAQVIRDHESHLAVRQHGGLRMPGSPGSKEEPARIVIIDVRAGERRARQAGLDERRGVGLAEAARPQPGQQRKAGHRPSHRRRVTGRLPFAKKGFNSRSLGQIDGLVGRDAKVGRNPDGPQTQHGKQGFNEFETVAGMHQHSVAFADAALRQRLRQRSRARVQLAPAETGIAAQQRCAYRVATRCLDQEMRQVHRPARCRGHAASWRRHIGRDRKIGTAAHLTRSRMLT